VYHIYGPSGSLNIHYEPFAHGGQRILDGIEARGVPEIEQPVHLGGCTPKRFVSIALVTRFSLIAW